MFLKMRDPCSCCRCCACCIDCRLSSAVVRVAGPCGCQFHGRVLLLVVVVENVAPLQDDQGETDDDRFARLEKLIVRATKRKDKAGEGPTLGGDEHAQTHMQRYTYDHICRFVETFI